jgi:hypothetical protein
MSAPGTIHRSIAAIAFAWLKANKDRCDGTRGCTLQQTLFWTLFQRLSDSVDAFLKVGRNTQPAAQVVLGCAEPLRNAGQVRHDLAGCVSRSQRRMTPGIARMV